MDSKEEEERRESHLSSVPFRLPPQRFPVQAGGEASCRGGSAWAAGAGGEAAGELSAPTVAGFSGRSSGPDSDRRPRVARSSVPGGRSVKPFPAMFWGDEHTPHSSADSRPPSSPPAWQQLPPGHVYFTVSFPPRFLELIFHSALNFLFRSWGHSKAFRPGSFEPLAPLAHGSLAGFGGCLSSCRRALGSSLGCAWF